MTNHDRGGCHRGRRLKGGSMLRHIAIVSAFALLPLADPAVAQTEIPQHVIGQLRDQGFREIRVSRTFLGRTRIVATNSEFRREIVINPSTGLILRDYWVVLSGDDEDGGGALFNPGTGGQGSGNEDDDDDDGRESSGSGGSGSDDDDDDESDDEDDDEDDDDNDDEDDDDDDSGNDGPDDDEDDDDN